MEHLPRLTILDQRYAIGRTLDATDGFVVAYQAWNLRTEDPVILLEYLPHSLARRSDDGTVQPLDEAASSLFEYGLEQFLKEAEVLNSLGHASVAQEIEQFAANGTAYRVQPYQAGASLDSVLKKQGGRLKAKTALAIMRPVLEALHAAHQQGLVHGALTPAALYLTKEGKPFLQGFRTAHLMLAQRTGQSGVLLRDGFSAPEQYYTEGQPGPWTDIYGAAATLFQMLAARSLPSASQRRTHDPVPDLIDAAPEIWEALGALLKDALALDIASRPRSVRSFLKRLIDAYDPSRPVASPPKQAAVSQPASPASAAPPTHPEDGQPATESANDTPKPKPTLPVSAPAAERRAAHIPAGEHAEHPETPAQAAPVINPNQPPQPEASQTSIRARLRAPDRLPRDLHLRNIPLLVAGLFVVLLALGGAYVVMQDDGNAAGQFAYFTQQGDSLFALADYAGAKAEYEFALQAQPGDGYVTDRLAETEERLATVSDTRYEQYAARGDSLLQLADSLRIEGEALGSLRYYAEANKAFYEALRYRPNDPDLLRKGQRSSAGMDQALRMDEQQNDQPSQEITTGGDEVSDQLFERYRQLGDERLSLGDYGGAYSSYSQALSLKPGEGGVLAQLRLAEARLADLDRREQYEQFMEHGTQLCNQGHCLEARDAFEQALALMPGDARAQDGLARIATMEAAQKQRDQQYRAGRGNGDAALEQGNHSEAAAHYRLALSARPGDDYVLAQLDKTREALPQQTAPEEPAPAPTPQLSSGSGEVHLVVEEAPVLIGGMAALNEEVQVPEAAVQAGISGRVYVQFIIDERGHVQNPEVVRGLGAGCDEEALRVIKTARFEPGKIGGKPVKVRHTLFIAFSAGGA